MNVIAQIGGRGGNAPTDIIFEKGNFLDFIHSS